MINPQMLCLLALGPIMLGPLQPVSQNGEGALSLSLCGGGRITIALGNDEDGPKQPPHSMSAACHAVMRLGEIADPEDSDQDGAL